MMCLLASWLAKVGGVQLLDRRVLMGLTDRVVLIRIVEDFRAERTDIHGVPYITWLLGLSAAVHTAARASHDLDEVVSGFTDLEKKAEVNRQELAALDYDTSCFDGGEEFADPAVIISQDGYILTNNHVINGANSVKVRLRDSTEYDATIIGSDSDNDIASVSYTHLDVYKRQICKRACLRIFLNVWSS